MLSCNDVRIDNRLEALGIDNPKPLFSWKLVSDMDCTLQTSYQIRVACGEENVWDSGDVAEATSVHIAYEGEPLLPQTRYTVWIGIMDNHGRQAEAEAWFETGLMSRYTGQWIAAADAMEISPVFQKHFSIKGKVESARVYASAKGIYELSINEMRVGNDYFTPGWTHYPTRIQYQTYDVTDMLALSNEIRMTVGKGWYCGKLGFQNDTKLYGDKQAAWLELHIQYSDGRKEMIKTDDSWRVSTGSSVFDDLYDGETIDLTAMAMPLQPVEILCQPTDVLLAQECEPVRITKRLLAKKRIITPKGEVVLDFGQNMSGVVQATLQKPRGTRVELHFAEVLDQNGNFYTENLRSAKATDVFVCSGDEDVFLPAFTYHGFRYLKVEGLGEDFQDEAFAACVMHSDLAVTGHFACSNEKINQLQSNITWGQRGNFFDVPTDCPQRDERLGWTGDAQMFCATAAFNMDVSLFFDKWLGDVAAEQTIAYGVPHVVPDILSKIYGRQTMGATAWGDAAAIIPWRLYEAYGNQTALEKQYPIMRDWVEFITGRAGENGLWQQDFQYGDWLALDAEVFTKNSCFGGTDSYFIANAFYIYCADLTAAAARILGNQKDAEKYEQLAAQTRERFTKEYVTDNGRLVCETQTACILALHFNLVKPEYRQRILNTLVENIHRHKDHLCTGFVGTPYLCHVLSSNGHHELAAAILLQEDFPSWLYEVNLGATTIWERWNSMHEDRSMDDSGMNSFNHYAYGAIGEWLYTRLVGLQAKEPGYRKSRIVPMPIEAMEWAEASKETPYGLLRCKWERKADALQLEITVPANTEAELVLPQLAAPMVLGSGEHTMSFPLPDTQTIH